MEPAGFSLREPGANGFNRRELRGSCPRTRMPPDQKVRGSMHRFRDSNEVSDER